MPKHPSRSHQGDAAWRTTCEPCCPFGRGTTRCYHTELVFAKQIYRWSDRFRNPSLRPMSWKHTWHRGLFGGRVMLVVQLQCPTAPLVSGQVVPWHGEELLFHPLAQCVGQVAQRRVKPVFQYPGQRVKFAYFSPFAVVQYALLNAVAPTVHGLHKAAY